MKIIDRYVLKNIFLPFIAGFLGFLALLSIQPLVKALTYVFRDKIAYSVAFEWFYCKITDGMFYSFPMAVLLGTLIGFSNLSKNSEIIAIISGGINFYRLLYPVFIFSIIVSLISFYFEDEVVPKALEKVVKLERTKIRGYLESTYTYNVLLRDGKDSILYVRKIDTANGKAWDFVIFYLKKERLVKKIAAFEAEYKGSKIWELKNCLVTYYNSSQKVGKTNKHYDVLKVKLNSQPFDFKRATRKLRHMSREEILEIIRFRTKRGLGGIRKLLTEYHLKLALPFATFLFALIGSSVGVFFKRGGAAVGFGLSILVVFAYYIIVSIFKSLGSEGVIWPFAAAWGGNVVTLIFAIYLLQNVKT